jgi:hypothetical protein
MTESVATVEDIASSKRRSPRSEHFGASDQHRLQQLQEKRAYSPRYSSHASLRTQQSVSTALVIAILSF